MTGVLIREKHKNIDWVDRLHEDREEDWNDASQGIPDSQHKLEEGRECSPLSLHRECGPASTFIWDFWIPKFERIYFWF
jgi:hypothetical protein